MDAKAWAERQEAWRRFSEWRPPPVERDLSTRLDWLCEMLDLAERMGKLEPLPIDSPEIREHRRRIRRGLAKIHD